MKSWLRKIRVFNRRKEGGSNPRREGGTVRPASEASQFVAKSRTLDTMLREQRRNVPFPATLHESIMREVRNTSRTSIRHSQPGWLRWEWAASLIMISLLVVVFTVHRSLVWPPRASSEASSPLTVASSTVENAGDIVRSVPGLALSPLTNETQNLRNDLGRAGEFLYASLP